MPRRDGTGPKGQGPKDGRGGGQGKGPRGGSKGQGSKSGGRQGNC